MLRTLFGLLSKQDIPHEQGPLYAAVRDALIEVRAYAQTHGGDIELVSVSEDGNVAVRMSGMCRGCPLSEMTFKIGIENQLKILVPGVRTVTKL
jgi:Fe-S cluster biogenesis protein NfuA